MAMLIDLNSLVNKEAEKAFYERWQLLGVADLSTQLPPIPWLCEAVGLAPGAVSLFAGYGYSRKTMALQAAAVSIAFGERLWGLFGSKQGRVLHLDYEQGRRVTQDRYQRLARGMGVELASLKEGSLTVGCMPKIYLDEEAAAEQLVRLCDGMTFAIVDSLRAAFPHADENSSEVRSYLDVLNRVSERTGCCMAVIHHARKPNKDNADGATFAIRGSSALFDACQSVYVFEGAKDTPTTVHHQKDRMRGVTCEDFGLTSEDVSKGADPRWGLRVVHLEAQQMAQQAGAEDDARDSRAVDKAAEQIVTFLASCEGGTFAGSRSDVRTLVHVKTGRFDRAWAKLVAAGVLVRQGTHREPVWTVKS